MFDRPEAARVAGLLREGRFQAGELRRQVIRDRQFRAFDGAEGRAPDYIGIGVQRAGTTRWHSLITAHPDVAEVFDPSGRVVKEVHWFDRPLTEDADERDRAYFSWFPKHETRVIGEWTPRYLYDLWPIDRICSLNPDIKMLVLLRDPLSRLKSAIQFYKQRGVTLGRDVLRESMWRGMYGTQIEYLLERVPRHQIHIGLYEECNERPEAELARLYEFLDLDPSFRPDGLTARLNSSAQLRLDPTIFESAHSLYRGDREKLVSLLPDLDISSWE